MEALRVVTPFDRTIVQHRIPYTHRHLLVNADRFRRLGFRLDRLPELTRTRDKFEELAPNPIVGAVAPRAFVRPTIGPESRDERFQHVSSGDAASLLKRQDEPRTL